MSLNFRLPWEAPNRATPAGCREVTLEEKPYLFAGDRQLAVQALEALIGAGDVPEVLCISDGPSSSHSDELVAIFERAGGRTVVTGGQLRGDGVSDGLVDLDLDLALSVHCPQLIGPKALSIPQRGWFNLHPSFLPYNRGWHTPTWAILEGTPAGVSLHQMVEEVDAGPIVAQREVTVSPGDTAHTLYQRLLEAELALLLDVWADLRADQITLQPNDLQAGTAHRRSDLFDPAVQELDLDGTARVGDVLTTLRGLTTNRWDEAAWFSSDGRRFRVRVDIREEPKSDREDPTAPATGY